MMKCIVLYFELAKKIIVESSRKSEKITYGALKAQTLNQFDKLKNMKFESPKKPKQETLGWFKDFSDEIENVFRNIMMK